MEQTFCQSCSMPMTGKEVSGTNADGTPNEEYCVHCYENGAFKQPDLTMAQMIDICVPFMVEDGMPEAQARALLNDVMPKLKRWSA